MDKEIRFYDEPPTFFILGFFITLEAIVLSMFVLNSQKRQARRDSIKADLDYQINRKAHMEIMQLHEKLDRLEELVAGLAGTTPTGPAAGADAAVIPRALPAGSLPSAAQAFPVVQPAPVASASPASPLTPAGGNAGTVDATVKT